LKLQYDETLSNFAFNFDLRRYAVAFHEGRDSNQTLPATPSNAF